ncbi:hypothetical protein N9C70_02675, partial [Flavobacteriales bacterium]|nr:hypothetical protein [Flavobacteriales bacterium]
MLFPKRQNHLFWACAILALSMTPRVLSGQVSLYSEDFESETPANTEDLCDPAYFPTDGNWALGPACSVPTNGIPKLVDVSGDAVLEFNQKYPENSEVWNSADIDATGVSNAIVSFDARSVGGFENEGPFVDDFAIYIVRDGEQDLTPLVSFSGHVDGTGDGTNQTVTASFSEAIDVAGDSEISLRILVGISGSDGSESYQLNNISICNDSNADEACTVCDEPIVLVNGAGAPFSTADSTVACISDLPQTCASDVAANRGSVTCAAFRSPLESTTCIATSAEGIGEDGAIVLVGAGDGGSDLFFEPSPEGLALTQTTDGEAWVLGQVQSVDDPLAILNVSIKYANGITGSEWRALNGPLAFKNDQGCPVTTAIEDSWLIYLMSTSTISFLTGEGNLAGTSLVLSHQPDNGYFGFQVGEMANNKSCNFGAGAWFSYEGTFNGVEVQSGFGDLLLDISCSTGDNNPCPTDDSEASLADALNTTLVYTVLDPSCPLDPIAEFTQVVSRLDTVAPTLIGVPNDTTVTCFDQIPALPVVTATDNCDAVTPIYSGGIANADSVGPGCYSVTNQWFVMDSCSNQTIATQTITVSDTLKPTIDLSCPSDTMIYVGASCDIDLTVANTGDITVNFADNCALETSGSTHNDVVTDSTSTGCYTIERTWTASAMDACG